LFTNVINLLALIIQYYTKLALKKKKGQRLGKSPKATQLVGASGIPSFTR
jgi:hypothetical protein